MDSQSHLLAQNFTNGMGFACSALDGVSLLLRLVEKKPERCMPGSLHFEQEEGLVLQHYSHPTMMEAM